MAGSSFDDAIKISFDGDRFRKTFDGSVSGSNPNVFYRFDVSSDRSRFSDLGVTLRGLDDDADLVLFNSRQRVIEFSSNSGDRSEVINRSSRIRTDPDPFPPGNPLAPGTYFLQVKRVSGATDFDLTISVVPVNNPAFRVRRPRPTETFSPGTLARARRVNIIGSNRIIEDAVGGGNTQDFYRIDLRRFSRVSFFLRDLNENADLDLINSQGQILRRSFNQGTQQETISVGFGRNPNATLAPGTYYVRVYRRGSRTSYELNMTAIETTRRVPTNSGSSAQLVSNVNPGADGSSPFDLTVFNGRLYFTADDGISGRELWSTDGTQAGTRLLLNINPGAASSNPTDLFVFNDALYFSANNGVSGNELWRTDGTATGTELVFDINPGAASSNPFDFASFNGQLYFAATDALGRELWRTDGASDVALAVTQRAADINAGTGGSNPTDLTVVGNTLFFAADDGTLGSELWSFNGVTPNLAGNINFTGGSNPFDLTNFNNRLYFSADDGGILGRELYQSDGTPSLTRLFVNLRAGADSSNPSDLERVGNFFFFAADDGTRGRELYRSDGTVNGTTLISDVNPGSDSSSPADLLNVNDSVVYFSAESSTAGRQLFRSGGTAQNTIQVTTSASPNLNPTDLVVFNNFIYFAGTTAASGTELFRVPAPAA
ncbi:MAG: pre-peptidase C-terminal domain-containing protein [Oculatellaceae cyanobacterium bins.114]|nr:pre-peptidase C-terminal domain-containing protein [Oculatellaceae cyanobacterium bins.114]